MTQAEVNAMHTEATRLRKLRGLPAQELSSGFCAVAQRWADHMAQTGKMRHGGGEEIIAWSSDPMTNAVDAFELWMGSAGHRAWVLSSGPQCGWGIARSQHGTYWAGEFTAGDDNPPKPPPPPAKPGWLQLLLKLLGRRISYPN